jgi:hypothetical protein
MYTCMFLTSVLFLEIPFIMVVQWLSVKRQTYPLAVFKLDRKSDIHGWVDYSTFPFKYKCRMKFQLYVYTI